MGKQYTRPHLVLFSNRVSSACGLASSASGPFYCPGDQRVYIDLAFYNQLATEFGAPGEIARAYVIAHEVGHHVQNLLGITDKASQAEQAAGRVGGNHVSVEVELQADCFAGVWAAQANQSAKISRARRFGIRPDRRLLRGRRYLAKARAGQRGAGYLHPRHLGAARQMVQAGFRQWRHRQLRYLQCGLFALSLDSRCCANCAMVG